MTNRTLKPQTLGFWIRFRKWMSFPWHLLFNEARDIPRIYRSFIYIWIFLTFSHRWLFLSHIEIRKVILFCNKALCINSSSSSTLGYKMKCLHLYSEPLGVYGRENYPLYVWVLYGFTLSPRHTLVIYIVTHFLYDNPSEYCIIELLNCPFCPFPDTILNMYSQT